MTRISLTADGSPRFTGSETTLDTVLFDVDDTLFDHSRALRTAMRRVREVYPDLHRQTLTDLCRHYSDHLTATYRRVVMGSMNQEEGRTVRFLALFKSCGAEPNRNVAQECAQIYREKYQESRYPVDGAPALLRALRAGGLTIGLVTNNTRAEQNEKLEAIGLRRSIDFMMTAQEVRIHKPDPRIFQRALERGDTTPGRAVMVGDSWDSDVLGASAAGIRAVWLNRANRESPDPSLATELRSLRPMRRAKQCVVTGRVLGGIGPDKSDARSERSSGKPLPDRNRR
ncbi:MAG: HAD family hydrolase [Thermoplasmata archaeon]